MNWQQLLEDRRVERHATSVEELTALRAVVERNLKDARVEAVSLDTRFGCAYEAALILATAATYGGYRVKGLGHHRTTFEALPLALPGRQSTEDARYFDRCRRLRNKFSYDAAGVVDAREVEELLVRVEQFQERVRRAVEARFRGAWS
jgi:hypothetical protein